ncbi:TPA: hypothetical protein ACXIGC_000637 [Stenotrophomonas maltophilia]
MELRTYGTRNVFLAQPGRYHEQLAATAMTPQQAEEFATVVNRAIRDKDRWWWIADVADEDTARAVAAAYLLNVKPDWAH